MSEEYKQEQKIYKEKVKGRGGLLKCYVCNTTYGLRKLDRKYVCEIHNIKGG